MIDWLVKNRRVTARWLRGVKVELHAGFHLEATVDTWLQHLRMRCGVSQAAQLGQQVSSQRAARTNLRVPVVNTLASHICSDL